MLNTAVIVIGGDEVPADALEDLPDRRWVIAADSGLDHASHIGLSVDFLVGDMDVFYLNLPVYRMETFLESTTKPYYGGSFHYARPMMGHSWAGYQDDFPMRLLRDMAQHIAKNAPEGHAPTAWHYE